MSANDRMLASLDILSHLVSSRLFHRARHIGCYVPMPEEVNTWPLIERAWRMKKRIFVPVIEKKRRMSFTLLEPNTTLATNEYGLAEPVRGNVIAPTRLDIVVAPLVAFDDEGNRIGMGGGYFDRTFSFLGHRERFLRPKLLGLAFACQKVAVIDASPWDVPLFQAYTENGAALRRGN